tara:strand:+ start:901 stop:1296 length:396 start_codon:yes stop_codon:yes gene_type:complete
MLSLFTALLLAAPAFSQRGHENRKPITIPSHSVKEVADCCKTLRKEVNTLKKEVAMLKRAMRMRGAKPEGKAPQGRKGRPGRKGASRSGRRGPGGLGERRGGRQIPADVQKKIKERIMEKIQEHKGSIKVT